jgi:DNA repair protein RadD
VRAGEFIDEEVEALMDQEGLVQAACAEIVEQTRDRHACLIFASGIRHGQHIVQVLRERHGLECGFVTGNTSADERRELLNRFKKGTLKYLCNVNVLTTGFDATNVDCVVLLRPTLSPGLYSQMVGRGFRIHLGKKTFLVLDFSGNVLRHGPVDQIKVRARDCREGHGGQAAAKECPACHALIATAYANCPECDHTFPLPEWCKHAPRASEARILSEEVKKTTYSVQDVRYCVHKKQGADDSAPRSMRVDYRVGWQKYRSEWVCFEHSGYPRKKAVAWWRRRSHGSVPDTAQQAVDLANSGGLGMPTSITTSQAEGEPYEEVIDWQVSPPPEDDGLDGEDGSLAQLVAPGGWGEVSSDLPF